MKKQRKPRAAYVLFNADGYAVAIEANKIDAEQSRQSKDILWPIYAPHSIEKYVREVKKKKKHTEGRER